jgi:ABC-type multidrug transport system fused ATPase/permease subunit
MKVATIGARCSPALGEVPGPPARDYLRNGRDLGLWQPAYVLTGGDAMSLAASSYSYPLLGVFWTIFEVFLWVIWFWILITVFIDIFRSQDLSGGAKALWFVFVLFIPLIGVLVYLIARGGKMHERAAQQASRQEEEFRTYVQETAGSQTPADQLAKLADLRDRGVITAEQFEREKAKVLA